MLEVVQASNDPFFNIAAEDFLLHERDEDFLILSINEPSVIIGKHQVAHMEVNARLVAEDGIPVIRRISGGGTVYHDSGNLNFAFIRQSEKGKQVDFRYYTKPVIEFLATLGLTAVFEGKNDLTVDGLKISGNAEHVFRERVLHHGTLLFDASMGKMKRYLKPDTGKYTTRGVPSNRTSVTNLKGRIRGIDTMEQFTEAMIRYFRNSIPGLQTFSFSTEETEKIRKLSETRYKSWEWNWGYGPPYEFTAILGLSGKSHRCRFLVKDGIIWESDITGSDELRSVAKNLIGCRHMHQDILTLLRDQNIQVSDEEVYCFF
ncbi:MAG: lipoate--protein ligase [Bacteroidales bacterium]|jgi:lipoate-protein ligase A